MKRCVSVCFLLLNYRHSVKVWRKDYESLSTYFSPRTIFVFWIMQWKLGLVLKFSMLNTTPLHPVNCSSRSNGLASIWKPDGERVSSSPSSSLSSSSERGAPRGWGPLQTRARLWFQGWDLSWGGWSTFLRWRRRQGCSFQALRAPRAPWLWVSVFFTLQHQ